MSGIGYRRDDLRRLADAKLSDAVLLYKNGRFSNAYYLAGYAIELAAKACISKQFSAETIPDPRLVQKLYTHNVVELVGLAGLSGELKARQTSDRQFAANWSTVSEWTEASRYDTSDQYTCGLMIDAVQDPTSGVLSWLKQYW